MTIGRILVQGEDEGTGFVIAAPGARAGRVVLTAAHVVGRAAEPELGFRLPGGRTIGVESVESDEGLDVAVLRLAEDLDGFVAAHARERLAWKVDARPLDSDGRLTGEVNAVGGPFRKQDGPEISVLQLLVDQEVDDYGGYSGSPVVIRAEDDTDNAVLGLLIEQWLSRRSTPPGQGARRATNTLYAVAIEDVLARFGLEVSWQSLHGGPSIDSLVPGYLAAIADRFRVRYDRTPQVPLVLVRGARGPIPDPDWVEEDDPDLADLIGPPTPPDRAADSGRAGEPVADLAAFQEQHGRVVLLGPPGAGKSVTLRGLVGALGTPWSDGSAGTGTRIPIYADLSEWHDVADDLPAFLQGQLRSLRQARLADLLPELMRNGRVVLLLDGLDVLPRLRLDPAAGRFRDPRAEAVVALGQRAEWKDCGCIVSCRSQTFSGEPDWHDVHLCDLDGDGVAAFAAAYLADREQATGRDLSGDFLRGLRSRSGELATLLSNPFFLAKALQYFVKADMVLDEPAKILEYLVRRAFRREKAEEAAALRHRLGRLAFRMTAAGEFGAVARPDVPTLLGADGADPPGERAVDLVVNTAAGAGLLNVTETEIRFSHQVVQEFFAAGFLRTEPLNPALVESVAQRQFDETWSWWARTDPTAPDRLVPFLRAATPAVRRSAATVLGALRAPAAADALALALADHDATVTWSAALSLTGLGDQRAVPRLIEGLAAQQDDIRKVSANALGVLADPRAVDPLLQALREDESTTVRAEVAEALGRSADARALHPLIDVLTGANERELADAAARALGRLGDPRAIPDLVARLDDTRGYGVVDGLLALGEQAVGPLCDVVVRDRNARRRARAAYVLGLSRRRQAVPVLVMALADRDAEVRRQSAEVLGHFGEAALAALLDVLDSGPPDAQVAALTALGTMRDPRAVGKLLELFFSANDEVAAQARRSLSRCGASAVEPLTEIMVQDFFDPSHRIEAAGALGGLGATGVATAVEALITHAQAQDGGPLREIAVSGLVEAVFGKSIFHPVHPRIVETLAAVCYDASPAVRYLAATGLARAGDARAVPVLAAMTGSEDDEIRNLAVESLGYVDDPAAVETLVTAMSDAAAQVAACEALRRILARPRPIDSDPDAAVPLLRALRKAMPSVVALLRSPDDRVVQAAIKTLDGAATPAEEVDAALLGDGGADDVSHRLDNPARNLLVPLRDPQAVSALIAVAGELDDESDDGWDSVRASVARWLGAVADHSAVPILLSLLDSSTRDVVSAAADALSGLGAGDALPALVAKLDEPIWAGATMSVVEAILALADDTTPGLLLGALHPDDPSTTDNVERLLRLLGERALTPLVAALAGDDPLIATAAASALDPGKAHDDDYFLRKGVAWLPAADVLDRLTGNEVELLVAARRSDDDHVARVARALLEKMGHPAGRPDPPPPEPPPAALEDLLTDITAPDLETRLRAAHQIGTRKDPRAIDPLTTLLEAEDPWVRCAAADALGELGDRSVTGRLGAVLTDPVPVVRGHAILALSRLGGTAALRLILGAVGDEEVRWAAAGALAPFDDETLCEVGPAAIVDAELGLLRQGSSHSDYEVYFGAVKVLPKLGAQARTMLLPALDDDHREVRHVAAVVLSEADDLRALPLLAWMESFDTGEYVTGGEPLALVARTGRITIQAAHKALAPLIEVIASEDRLVRIGAAFRLAQLGWTGAVDVMTTALADTDRRIRWAAARTLGELGGEQAIASLITALGDPDDKVRDSVTRALMQFGPAALPEVCTVLTASGSLARSGAAMIVGELGGAAEIAGLIAALDDAGSDPGVYEAAANALIRLDERGKTEGAQTDAVGAALSRAFWRIEAEEDRDTRAVGAARRPAFWRIESAHQGTAYRPVLDALLRFDQAAAIDLLVEALGSRHLDIRSTAVLMLGRSGDSRAIEPLNRALTDEDPQIREKAAYGLRSFADASSVEPLIRLLTEGTGLDVLAAVRALVAIGDPRAAAPMIPLLLDSDPIIWTDVAEAVTALADAAAIDQLVAQMGHVPRNYYDDPDGTASATPALDVLVRVGPRAAEAIVRALAQPSPDPEVQFWGPEAIRRMGPEVVALLDQGLHRSTDDAEAARYAERLADRGEPGRAVLASAITEERAEVRARAAYGLGCIPDEAAMPLLVGALRDPVADVRAEAAFALGGFDDPGLIEPLAAVFGDTDEAVRVTAAISLLRLGDDRGAGALCAALTATDPELARAAAFYLGELGLEGGVGPLLAALEQGPAELRAECAAALGKIGDSSALTALDRAAGDTGELTGGGTVGAVAAAAAEQIRPARAPAEDDLAGPELLPPSIEDGEYRDD